MSKKINIDQKNLPDMIIVNPDGTVETVETVVEVTDKGKQAAQALPSDVQAEAYVAVKAQKREANGH